MSKLNVDIDRDVENVGDLSACEHTQTGKLRRYKRANVASYLVYAVSA